MEFVVKHIAFQIFASKVSNLVLKVLFDRILSKRIFTLREI